MCGMNFKIKNEQGSIELMQSAIQHRGPDNSKTRKTEFFEVGHCRLSVNGLDSRFDQPMQSGKSLFMFTGEFYDFRLYDPGAENDSEVLFSLLKTHSDSFLNEIDWMGSIIYIPDVDKPEAFIYTDFLSKKPMYINLETLSVSSEIKSLVLPDSRVDGLYLQNCIKWGYAPGSDSTPYVDIKKIEPGSSVRITPDGMSIRSYGGVRPKSGNLKELMTDSVSKRLLSDVPIALLLSGGFDSSLVYKLMEKQTHDFTIFHVDNGESEFLDYLQIPGDIDIRHLEPASLDLDEMIKLNEGIQDLGSLIPQVDLAKAMSGETKVVITGDGADELFGGYRRSKIYDSQLTDIWCELVGYHLPRLDKINMGFSIEQRSPFLSRSVLEHALSMPYSDRVDKNGLRDSFRGIVPDKIIDRPKLPLKSQAIHSDPIRWRSTLFNRFIEMDSLRS